MQDGEEFYNIVGVADSIIRERIFQAMTDLFSPTGDYDDIYNLWLR